MNSGDRGRAAESSVILEAPICPVKSGSSQEAVGDELVDGLHNKEPLFDIDARKCLVKSGSS